MSVITYRADLIEDYVTILRYKGISEITWISRVYDIIGLKHIVTF
jgi:hypothetical protein